MRAGQSGHADTGDVFIVVLLNGDVEILVVVNPLIVGVVAGVAIAQLAVVGLTAHGDHAGHNQNRAVIQNAFGAVVTFRDKRGVTVGGKGRIGQAGDGHVADLGVIRKPERDILTKEVRHAIGGTSRLKRQLADNRQGKLLSTHCFFAGFSARCAVKAEDVLERAVAGVAVYCALIQLGARAVEACAAAVIDGEVDAAADVVEVAAGQRHGRAGIAAVQRAARHGQWAADIGVDIAAGDVVFTLQIGARRGLILGCGKYALGDVHRAVV